MRRALSLVVATLALTPATADAHSLVRVADGELRYISADAVSLNSLTITVGSRGYRIADTTVEGGIDPGPCDPGDVDSDGYIREVFCPTRRITRIHADLGTQDDRAQVTAAVPATILGGPGRDTLTGTAQDDLINGEDGDDEVVAGAGDDKLAGAAGNDRLECGEGSDQATVDGGDTVAPTCESTGAALPPELVVKADRVAPALLLGGPRRQPLGSRLVVLATSSELGSLRGSAAVRIGRKRYRLPGVTVPVEVEGEGVDVEFSVPARLLALARRSRGPVTVRVTVVATDRDGNRTVPGVERSLTLAR